tara:strand:- start:835 stop:1527 length:693 start_codon:yes stop_codon:yes gene_type:complete
MPTIDATNVGTVQSAGFTWIGATWTSIRDATSGTADLTSDGQDLGVSDYIARGANWWLVHRVFARFATASISIAPSAATLKIYGRSNYSFNNADFFVVRGTQGTGDPAGADFDAMTGWDTSTAADGSGAGDQESNITKYSNEWVNGTTAWDESDYNEIALNPTALAHMASLDNFYICIIESVHDLRDVSETHNSINGMYFDDDAGKEMQIDYTAGVAAAADNAVFFGTNF